MNSYLLPLAAAFAVFAGVTTTHAAVIPIDFDTAATGSNLLTTPLVTPAGTVTLSPSGYFSFIKKVPGAGQSLLYQQYGDNANRGLLSFSFDVASVTFDYLGYSIGDITVEALDSSGNVVDSFTQVGTHCSTCFDGQNIVLEGAGIRALRFADTSATSNEVALDNVRIDVPTLGATGPAPDGNVVFKQVDGGENFTCGIRQSDSNVECWGLGTGATYRNDDYGQARPPQGVAFKQISAGKYHTCGVKTDGYAQCWGWNDIPWEEGNGPAPVSTYVGQANAPQDVLFDSVSTGWYHSCGLYPDGYANCWGNNYDTTWDFYLGQGEDRAGPFAQISSGAWHNCAVRKSDGMVECWGGNGYGQSKPPAYKFKKVAAGQHFTCGIRADSDSAIDGDVACWGANTYFQAPAEVDGPFVDVAAGDLFACAKRADGTLDCWGYYLYGQNKEPTGKFSTFGLGDAHGCAVYGEGTYTGKWLCWGKDSHGQAPDNTTLPPTGGTPEDLAPIVSIELTPSEPDRANGRYAGPVIVTPQITDDSDIADVRCALDPSVAPTSFDKLPTGACEFVGGASLDVRGTHTVYLAAKDVWGNKSNVVSVTFTIDWPFEFRGFLPPVLAAPALNLVNAGRVIPLKLRVSGDWKLAAGSSIAASIEVTCGTLKPIGTTWLPAEPAGSGALASVPATGQFYYVWKAPREWQGTCRALAVRLEDGVWHQAFFKFR
jgi:hypothetical protein